MSSDLKKSIDITPNGVLNPGSRQDYLWLRSQPWWEEILPDTRYIRFWVDWPSLQPDPTYALGEAPPGSIERFRLENLDAQIRAANADKLKVILMPYRYPQWANGTAQIRIGTDDDRLFEPEHRALGSAFVPWFFDRTRAAPSLKDLRYRLPGSHAPESSWGTYVRALFERWVDRADIHGRAHAIEVVNEPNFQLWPQRGPAADTSTLARRFEVGETSPFRVNQVPTSQMTIHLAVAEMMQTVDVFARAYQPTIMCFAPSTSDTDLARTGAYRRVSKFADTPYSTSLADAFVPRLLDELDRVGFKGGGRWLWSFHNYNDWERAEDRATYLRALLNGRWRGRADALGEPVLVATEGGCRLARVDDRFPGVTGAELLQKHAVIVTEGIARFGQDTGVGAGVRLLTQYTVCADPGFDDGLRNSDGGWRPAWDAWCAKSHLD
jgi:hypothetical protein